MVVILLQKSTPSAHSLTSTHNEKGQNDSLSQGYQREQIPLQTTSDAYDPNGLFFFSCLFRVNRYLVSPVKYKLSEEPVAAWLEEK